jgi:hypothetical protein
VDSCSPHPPNSLSPSPDRPHHGTDLGGLAGGGDDRLDRLFGHELSGAAQALGRLGQLRQQRDDLVLEHQDEEDEPGRDAGQNDRHQQELETEEDDDDVPEALQRRLIGATELIETEADTDDDQT